jgi:coiled-coil domain-containing protein 130
LAFIDDCLDPDKKDTPVDPLAALEKTSEAQANLTKVQIPRLEALQSVSEHFNADPYSLSLKARKKFRAEKKIDQAKRKADEDLKGRYGLPASLSLLEDDAKAKEEAKSAWEEAKQLHHSQQNAKRRRIGGVEVPLTSSSSGSSAASSKASSSKSSLDTLRARILSNTAKNGSSTESRISSSKSILPIRKL